jgi:hypothetical protein
VIRKTALSEMAKKTNKSLLLPALFFLLFVVQCGLNIYLLHKGENMKKRLFTIAILFLTLTAFAQERRTPVLSREQQLNKEYCSGLFCTIEGTYIDLENDPAAIGANTYINILDWMRGRVAGLQVYNIRGTLVPFLRNLPAAIFVDEIRMDASFLNALPVNDIAFIKVIRSPYATFWGAPGVVIAIYTKRGEVEEEEEG